MNARERKSAMVWLLLVANVALLAFLGWQALANRKAARDLSQTVTEVKDSAAGLESRCEALTRERTRWQVEALEGKDGIAERDAAIGKLEEEIAGLRAELDRIRAERDEHLEARLGLERRLEDALDLLQRRDR